MLDPDHTRLDSLKASLFIMAIIVSKIVAFLGIFQSVSSDATTVAAPRAEPTGASVAVNVNQGLLVTGAVRFGVVPVPNLCVELRGYDAAAAAAAAVDQVSATSSAPLGPGGIFTAPAGGGNSWRGWGETEGEGGWEPRFVQLQRTSEPDGSFLFVAPETGLVLVLASYAHGSDHPTAVRVFSDSPSLISGGGGGETTIGGAEAGRGGQQEPMAFGGVDSGRLRVDVDLAGATHAPEVLWSAAAGDNDRSPCARFEAESSGSTPSEGREALPSALQSGHGRQISWGGLSRLFGGNGGGGSGNGNGGGSGSGSGNDSGNGGRIRVALLTDWLRAFCRNVFNRLGAVSSEATFTAGRAFLRPGVEKAEGLVHEVIAKAWLPAKVVMTMWSKWAAQKSTELSSRFGHRSRQFSAWSMETAIRLSTWLEHSPVALEACLAVWWIRILGIALVLGALQQVHLVAHKLCRATTVVAGQDGDGGAGDDGRRRRESRHPPAADLSSGIVGTFHTSDGRTSHVDFWRFVHPEQPAADERQWRGISGALWGSNRAAPAAEVGCGKREETDDFSSIFSVLNHPSCAQQESKGDGSTGATSSVFVVTQ